MSHVGSAAQFAMSMHVIVLPHSVCGVHEALAGQVATSAVPDGHTGTASQVTELGPVHQIVAPHIERS